MNTFLIIIFGLLPSVLSVGLFYIFEQPLFKKIPHNWKSIGAGILFGGLCILSTELSPTFLGAPNNIRTASVVTSTFIFGWPAGLISGFIGSFERGISLIWNPDRAFTEIACTTATAVAGIVSALLRKYMFDDKTPSPIAGALITAVIECFHLLLIFITNINDPQKSFLFVQNMSWSIIGINTAAVFLAILIQSILIHLAGMDDYIYSSRRKKMASAVQINLILAAAVSFVLMIGTTFAIEDHKSNSNCRITIQDNIHDIQNEVSDSSDIIIGTLSELVVDDIEAFKERGGYTPTKEDINPKTEDVPKIPFDPEMPMNKWCAAEADFLGVTEINLCNDDGFIYATNQKQSWRFCLGAQSPGSQAREFHDHLNSIGGSRTYCQDFGPITEKDEHGNPVYRKYAGTKIDPSLGGYIQTGYNSVEYYENLNLLIKNATTYRRVGTEGRLMIADYNKIVVSDRDNLYTGRNLESIFGYDITTKEKTNTIIQGKIGGENGTDSYYLFNDVEGYYVIGSMSRSEVESARDTTIYVVSFLEVIVFAILIIAIYAFINKLIVKKLETINNDLQKITDGNLDVKCQVRTMAEFEELSNNINKTVDRLKKYIDEANMRIDRELSFAKQIQASSLPAPLDIKPSLDLYALMATAKEVGGDFYDFYYLDDNHIVILVADVSGKGIPAAMFMMKSKTLIKSLVLKGLSPEDAFHEANNELCKENDAEMFVTAWMGIINISNGHVLYCNAGHNAPIIGNQDKHDFHYYRSAANLVLGGLSDVPYKLGEFDLEEGETIFLYTDGVTEATNINKQLFSEQRLLDFINKANGFSNRMLVKSVKKEVDLFQGEADQFDDITMLAFTYLGSNERYHLNIKSDNQEFEKVYDFVNKTLSNNVPDNKRKHLLVALDEILSNICNYSYKDKQGPIDIVINIDKEQVTITIADEGPFFNPLDKEDPNIALSAEERDIGGLGIFMVKQLMDDVSYQYLLKKNILTMTLKK